MRLGQTNQSDPFTICPRGLSRGLDTPRPSLQPLAPPATTQLQARLWISHHWGQRCLKHRLMMFSTRMALIQMFLSWESVTKMPHSKKRIVLTTHGVGLPPTARSFARWSQREFCHSENPQDRAVGSVKDAIVNIWNWKSHSAIFTNFRLVWQNYSDLRILPTFSILPILNRICFQSELLAVFI